MISSICFPWLLLAARRVLSSLTIGIACILLIILLSGSDLGGIGTTKTGLRALAFSSHRHHQSRTWMNSKDTNNYWYRIGEPFDPLSVSTVAVVFSPGIDNSGDDHHVERLLIFGQSLAGLFSSDVVCFVAATLKSSSVVVRTKCATQPITDTRTWEVQLPKHDAVDNPATLWYRLLICTRCSEIGKLSSIPSPMGLPSRCTNSFLEGVQAWCERGEGSLGRFTTRFTIDSGLYVAGVVDSRATFGRKNIRSFEGSITVYLYNSNCKLLNTTSTGQGITVESYRTSLDDRVKPALAKRLEIKLNKKATPTLPYIDRFPIVTAVSDNHANEVEAMVATVQRVMPQRGVIIYDLGLTVSNIKRLRSFCNVSIRHFPSHLYPDLVKEILEYRWKPLIIFLVFHEFGGVAWADASIRFKQKISTVPFFRRGHGFVGFNIRRLSPVGSFTHNGTLVALGVERDRVAKSKTTIGTFNIWLSGHDTSEVLLDHWNTCAFDQQCMAPPGARRGCCMFELKKTFQYMGCHRYDQSALSVILEKIFLDPLGKDYLIDDVDDMARILKINHWPDPNVTVSIHESV